MKKNKEKNWKELTIINDQFPLEIQETCKRLLYCFATPYTIAPLHIKTTLLIITHTCPDMHSQPYI